MALVKEAEQYKYRINLLEVVIPGKDTVSILPANINSIGIEKDFDNDHFPILYLSVNMAPDVYYDILENKTTVKFRVRLENYIYDSSNVIRKTNVIFNDIFSIFIDDNSSFINKEIHKKSREIQGGGTMMTDYATPREFFLFKESDLINSKKVINTVISSGTMTTISTFLLSQAGINKVLMTPMDNNAVYEEVLLPPASLIQNLLYLEKHYGMYYHGLLLFFDFERAYFINKRGACTAWQSGEYKDVVIESFKTSNPNSMTLGCYKDADNKTYVVHVSRDNLAMTTSSMIDDQLSGNNVFVIDSANGGYINVKPDVQQRGSGTTKILIDNLNNYYTKTAMNYRKMENDSIITLKLQNIDMAALTPNKKFKFIFEDTAIQKTRGGIYRLCGVTYSFIKQGVEFIAQVNAVFKKLG